MQQLYQDRLSGIDEILLVALRAVFDERIAKEKPVISSSDDNILLGQKYRTYEECKQIIDKSFIDIKSYKTGRPAKKVFAKER
jgi:hypothetical protein